MFIIYDFVCLFNMHNLQLKIDVKEMNEKNRSLTNDHRLVETEFESLQKQNDELQSDINNYLFEKQRVLVCYTVFTITFYFMIFEYLLLFLYSYS